MSLCAQHSSRPFTDRLLRITSFFPLLFYSFFFLVLFSKCTANHPPLTYFALALTKFQDHAASPGETRFVSILLPSVVEASLLSMPECYPSDVLCFFKFLYFAIFLIPIKKQIASREKYRPPRSRLIAPVTTDAALAISTKKSPTCMCVCSFFLNSFFLIVPFFFVKKKKEQSHTSRCAWQLHLPDLVLYHLTRFNARWSKETRRNYIWKSREKSKNER